MLKLYLVNREFILYLFQKVKYKHKIKINLPWLQADHEVHWVLVFLGFPEKESKEFDLQLICMLSQEEQKVGQRQVGKVIFFNHPPVNKNIYCLGSLALNFPSEKQ